MERRRGGGSGTGCRGRGFVLAETMKAGTHIKAKGLDLGFGGIEDSNYAQRGKTFETPLQRFSIAGSRPEDRKTAAAV